MTTITEKTTCRLPPLAESITSMYETQLFYNKSSGIENKSQHHEQDGIVNTNNTYNKCDPSGDHADRYY